MTRQQKAVFVKELGKPVELGHREIPSPKEDEVLLEVTATMLLPHDSYCRDWGLFIDDKLPWVLGTCVAGIVSEVGSEVTCFKPDDLVFGLSDYSTPYPDQAGLQQYAILNENAMAKVPTGFTDEQMVTLPVNLTTSWNALFSSAGFGFPSPFSQEGKTYDYSVQNIVIIGGGSNVGKLAIQLASLAGIDRIVTVAGLQNKATLLKMGATHVLDRHAPEDKVAAQIHSIVGNGGARHVYDCVDYSSFSLALAILPESAPSKLRTLLPLDSLDTTRIPLCEALAIESTNELIAPHQREFWDMVPKWVGQGRVVPSGFRVVNGLDNVEAINRALDEYQDFERSGVLQVVVRV